MRRTALLMLSAALFAAFTYAHREAAGDCGTGRETVQERLFLHRQSVRARAGARLLAAPVSTARDIGDIAIVSDADGVVSRLNQFNLDHRTLTFTPSAPTAARYRYTVSEQGYDAAAASSGAPLAGLGDDDTRKIALPFAFPYFGSTYTEAYVNSDGNLTFTAGDNASADRSASRMHGGAPRIAPLFDDLDPSARPGGVRVLSEPGRVVVSWVAVPEYSSTGFALNATFQARLYPDGSIAFSYSGAPSTIANAVVGISPGNLTGSSTLVDFATDAGGEYAAMVAEWFSSGVSVDVVAAAQKFYATHEDAYDYLLVFNAMDIPALSGAIAYTDAVRTLGTGYGKPRDDHGQGYGSPSRLQALMNMGPLSQYDSDPLGPVGGRPGDTPLSIIAHEAGHLFLAYASVSNPGGTALPMLGYQGSHWSFLFNSEASFLEGERILDMGEGFTRRFVTAATVSHYAPLDQYLMGFRAANEVPDTMFVVNNPNPAYSPLSHPPSLTARFDGVRRDISIDELALAAGRRTPDSTVAQRRFRFGFVVVTRQGSDPAAADLSKAESLRYLFPDYFATATDNRAFADTTLRRAMALSLAPAAGVTLGGSAAATLTLSAPPSAPLTVHLDAPGGFATVPSMLTIPAGARSVSFTVAGARPGVEELAAYPISDTSYETAYARLQVAAPEGLRLVAVSGDHQTAAAAGPLPEPIVVRLTDANDLPYPGARILATASKGGSVSPAVGVAGAGGAVSFQWSPGAAAVNQLLLAVDGAPQTSLAVSAGSAAPAIQSVQNAASFEPGLSAGAIETLWGVNLAGGKSAAAPPDWPTALEGVTVTLDGRALRLLFVSDTQINFYAPQDAPPGAGSLTVQTPSGALASAGVTVTPAQPGIFAGAVLRAGTGVSAATAPVPRGAYIEIYCTGLGATRSVSGLQWTAVTPVVFVGGAQAKVTFSGLAPGYAGLYQVNAEVPAEASVGMQPVTVSLNQLRSNAVGIIVQ
jgi:uncharacterized protein (TIGR03437 family)